MLNEGQCGNPKKKKKRKSIKAKLYTNLEKKKSSFEKKKKKILLHNYYFTFHRTTLAPFSTGSAPVSASLFFNFPFQLGFLIFDYFKSQAWAIFHWIWIFWVMTGREKAWTLLLMIAFLPFLLDQEGSTFLALNNDIGYSFYTLLLLVYGCQLPWTDIHSPLL